MRLNLWAYALAGWILFFPAPASAYIGPGLGTGAITAVLGILAGLLMLVAGVIWYPLKRLIRHLRPRR